ncbi:Putative CCA tRNA nucleotidyltransferase 1 [Galdieria sulphuraria]|nr:Putative CCA tRNA nucleotidyltransferase 1 [Galdieria sulphuraria]
MPLRLAMGGRGVTEVEGTNCSKKIEQKRPLTEAFNKPEKFFSAKKFIDLEAREEELFRLLLDAVNVLETGTTLRVAGGWVRDKLLKINKEEPDIDLALDNMMGREFANKLQFYLKSRNITCGHIAIIQQNPEQSKHLETARVKVNGIYLDLVNLRKESYAHHSRIPEIQIGTPYEDAVRRDLTINSLFYNLNEDIIEDFSGKGFDDLKNRIIRTPMEPKETLLDDPLRALRVIRFATRFDFDMDPALYNCCKSREVHVALGEKVSRERVGSEIDYMLKTASYVRGIGILYETGLYKAVFIHPRVIDSSYSLEDSFYQSLLSISKLNWIRQRKILSYHSAIEEHTILEELGVFSVAFHFYETFDDRNKVNLAQYILRHCLKRRVRECDSIMTVLEGSTELMAHLINDVPSSDMSRGVDGEPLRLTIGRILKRTGSLWNIAFKVACCRILKGDLQWDTFSHGRANDIFRESREDSNTFLSRIRSWESFIIQLGIEDIHKWKPLFNGNEVLSLLPKLPRGPKMKQILDAQIEWMLMNPKGTKEDCRKWLLDEYQVYCDPSM